MATFPRGRFVWHELLTTDPEAASAFYAKVVGWKAQAWEHANAHAYQMWMMGERPMGGLMRLPDEARRMGAPSHWMPYIAVPDVDQTVREAEGRGARVYVPPRDIPPGRFATLADPWGAAFSVFKPGSPEGMGTDETQVGGFSWHEHVSDDWKNAWEFYSTLFGWAHAASMEMGPGNTYWMFKRAGGDEPMGGMYNRPPGMQAPPHWLCYVRVPSADAAAATALRLGGAVTHGPVEVPGGARIAMCMDPQGAALAVHSLAAPVRRRAAAASRPKRGAKRKPARKAKATAKRRTAKRAKRPPAKRRPRRTR